MSISPIVSGGLGAFGGVNAIPTQGFIFSGGSTPPPSGGSTEGIGSILTQGLGAWGGINLMPGLGFGVYTVAPPATPLTQGYMSGSYVTRMSEAEFQRRRKLARYDLNDMALRIFAEQELPELHAELIALTDDVTVEQKRAREMRIAAIIDRKIYVDYETELRAADDEEEELLMTYLLN